VTAPAVVVAIAGVAGATAVATNVACDVTVIFLPDELLIISNTDVLLLFLLQPRQCMKFAAREDSRTRRRLPEI
jgi:hypothetical protein